MEIYCIILLYKKSMCGPYIHDIQHTGIYHYILVECIPYTHFTPYRELSHPTPCYAWVPVYYVIYMLSVCDTDISARPKDMSCISIASLSESFLAIFTYIINNINWQSLTFYLLYYEPSYSPHAQHRYFHYFQQSHVLVVTWLLLLQ